MIKNPKIMVAGASGYIGNALLSKLLERFPDAQITALSRNQQALTDPRITWKSCDLFSLKSLEDSLSGPIDLAYYLVHSMGPTAHLDQGSFADYDLLLADNFARVMQRAQVKHLIYLGGLIPENVELSLHLQSRLEVEETFAQYNLPITVFRAGLIIGESGSSFQILLKLVDRLPLMICPYWTQTQTTPVDLESVLKALGEVALDPVHFRKIYDLAGCESLTYLEMMRETAQHLGKKRCFLAVPFFTPTLSRLWVSLITRTPKALVYPLIESLQHPMIARSSYLYFTDHTGLTYRDLLKKTSFKIRSKGLLFLFRPQRKKVRSVQRLPLPSGKNAEWVKNRFLEWLPSFLKPFVKVKINDSFVNFSIFSSRLLMLQLKFSSDRSTVDRQLFYILGGLLVSQKNSGRLEFRVVLNRRYIIAAIHDYSPALPWFIYRYTQAILHIFVMRGFGRELLNESNTKNNSLFDI